MPEPSNHGPLPPVAGVPPFAGRGRPASRASRARRPGIEALEGRGLMSLAIQVRYDFDALNFFDTPAKRDAMQATADSLAATLGDHLAAIVPSGGNSWRAILFDPATGGSADVPGLIVPADTLIVFVGSRDIDGALGQGGGGSAAPSGDAAWYDLLRSRGVPGALANPPTAPTFSWGGSVSFDESLRSAYFGPLAGWFDTAQVDFSKVAAHELGHVLGIGTEITWGRYVTPGGFVGPAATAATGGAAAPLVAGGHWAPEARSDGYVPAMSPGVGTRHFTGLDYAGLADVGWTVDPERFQFAEGPYEVASNAAEAAITIVRLGGAEGAATVRYATVGSSAFIPPRADSLAKRRYERPATAGVDYVPVEGTLTFGPGEVSKTIAVPILGDPTRTSGRPLRLVLSRPSAGAALGAGSVANLVIGGPPVAAPPMTRPPVTVERYSIRGTRRGVTMIAITFDGPLDPAAANPAHFGLRERGRDRRLGTRDDKALKIRGALYDVASRTITLRLARPLAPGQVARLLASGQGLRDALGRPIDGAGSQVPGSDFVATVRGAKAVRPARG